MTAEERAEIVSMKLAGRTYREIAAVTGRPRGTISGLLSTASAKLLLMQTLVGRVEASLAEMGVDATSVDGLRELRASIEGRCVDHGGPVPCRACQRKHWVEGAGARGRLDVVPAPEPSGTALVQAERDRAWEAEENAREFPVPRVDERARVSLRRRGQPRPTHDEVVGLVVRAQDGDLVARDEVVRANMGIVCQAARKIARSDEVKYAELVQQGVLGLLRAVEKYNPGNATGASFVTYAFPWVRSFMQRWTWREYTMLSGMSNYAREARFVHQYEQQRFLGREHEEALEIVAAGGKVSARELEDYVEVAGTTREVSFDAPLTADGEGSLHDVVEGGSADESDRDEHRERVREALKTVVLSPREKTILERRLFVASGDEASLQEVGDEMGLSKERIRQLEVVLLRKLRREFEARGLGPRPAE